VPARLRGSLQFFGQLQRRWPDNWRDVAAELTRFYHWGPDDIWSLTWSQMQWWNEQAARMLKQEKAAHGK
jgi:hypothetical protein